MNCLTLLRNRLVVKSQGMRQLLNAKNCLNKSHSIVNRELNLWQEKTLRHMYWRSKRFDAVKRPLEPRSVHQEWNLRSELFAFSRRLNENLSEERLQIVFTHHSFIQKEIRDRQALGLSDVSLNITDNKSFAQIGQNICESYIKSYLRHFLTRLPEDGIRAITDYLMSDQVLGDVAKWIGCIDLVLCEEFPPQEPTLAKTVKALVGAIADEKSEKSAQNFVLDFILTYLADKDLLEIWDIPHPRYHLKAILDRERLPAPEYRLIRESAVATIEACYVVGLYVNKELIGSAPGETIEIAKQMADLDALRRLFRLTPSDVVLKFGPKVYSIDLSQSTEETLDLNEWTTALLKDNRVEGKQVL